MSAAATTGVLPSKRKTGTVAPALPSVKASRPVVCASERSVASSFSVTTGTVFHASHVSLRIWLMIIFEMSANKNGVAAREIERKYDLTTKKARFVLRERTTLEGAVQADVHRSTVLVTDENRGTSKRPGTLPGTSA